MTFDKKPDDIQSGTSNKASYLFAGLYYVTIWVSRGSAFSHKDQKKVVFAQPRGHSLYGFSILAVINGQG